MAPVISHIKHNPLLPNDPSKLSLEQQPLNYALILLSQQHQPRALLTGPKATRDFLRLLLGNHFNEVFGCILLDSQHAVIDLEPPKHYPEIPFLTNHFQ